MPNVVMVCKKQAAGFPTMAWLIRSALRFVVWLGILGSFFIGPNAVAITLEESIEQVLLTSDQIRMIEAERNRADAEADQVDAFTETRLDSSLSYNELGTSQEDSPFFSSPDRQMTTGLTVSRLLWAGERIPDSRSLKGKLMKLAGLEEDALTRDLVKDVSTAFLTVLYQGARLEVLKDRVGQRSDELGDATDLFEAGMVTNLDVREAKLNLNVARDDLRSGESDFHTVLVDFNLVLGEGAESKKELLVPRGSLVRAAQLNEALGELELLYQEGRQLDIRTAEAGVEISDKNFDLARGALMPEVAFVAGAEYGGEPFSDLETSWNVGAQMSWNLFDGGAKKNAIASALARKSSRNSSLIRTRKALSGTINKLNNDVNSLEKRIALQEKTVELSNGNYEDARALYGNGTMTLTRLGDFNLLYAEARFNLLRLYYLENLIAIEVTALLHEKR